MKAKFKTHLNRIYDFKFNFIITILFIMLKFPTITYFDLLNKNYIFFYFVIYNCDIKSEFSIKPQFKIMKEKKNKRSDCFYIDITDLV